MERTTFSLTYDYRCPFARIANDHVTTALRADAPFDVHFSPFVLGGVYGVDGDPKIWDDRSQRSQLKALAASAIVREQMPDQFLDVHDGFFNLRHDKSGDLRDDATIRTVLKAAGVDDNAVYTELEKDWPYELIRTEHQRAMVDHDVFGVPTFIANGHAAFVRLMKRPNGDAKVATTTVELVLNLLFDHVELNEFKHTSVPN